VLLCHVHIVVPEKIQVSVCSLSQMSRHKP